MDSNSITLSHADHVAIGSKIAGFLMFREWNVPHNNNHNIRTVVLSEESVQAIADELAARLV